MTETFYASMIGIIFLLSGLRVVHQQNIAIIETFGRFSRSAGPGLTWIFPFVQRIAARMDLRIVEIKDKVEVKTADNAFVLMPVALMIQVIEERVEDAYYKLANPIGQVKTWALNALRSSAADLKLDQLYQDREHLERAIQAAVAERMMGYGYEIAGVLVDQPAVSDEVQTSFNRVVASQRELEAARQEAEAIKVKMVGEARAEAESQELRAQGLAKARKILADSLSEAISQAKDHGITQESIMHLLLETNRLDAIRASAEHGKLVVMDVRSPEAVRPVLPVQ